MPHYTSKGSSKYQTGSGRIGMDSVIGQLSDLKIEGIASSNVPEWRSGSRCNPAKSRYGGTNVTSYNPRPYNAHTAGEFQLGDIIRTPHIVPRLNKNPVTEAESRHVLQSGVGDILYKERYFVVLAKFPTHMIAVPITSHDDRGIDHLPENVRIQYMGIRARDDTSYVNKTSLPALVVAKKKFALMPTSHVQATSPITVSYNFKIENVGQLEPSSYDSLTQHYKVQMSFAFKR